MGEDGVGTRGSIAGHRGGLHDTDVLAYHTTGGSV